MSSQLSKQTDDHYLKCGLQIRVLKPQNFLCKFSYGQFSSIARVIIGRTNPLFKMCSTNEVSQKAKERLTQRSALY